MRYVPELLRECSVDILSCNMVRPTEFKTRRLAMSLLYVKCCTLLPNPATTKPRTTNIVRHLSGNPCQLNRSMQHFVEVYSRGLLQISSGTHRIFDDAISVGRIGWRKELARRTYVPRSRAGLAGLLTAVAFGTMRSIDSRKSRLLDSTKTPSFLSMSPRENSFSPRCTINKIDFLSNVYFN